MRLKTHLYCRKSATFCALCQNPQPQTSFQCRPSHFLASVGLFRTLHGPNLFRCHPPVANQFLADAEVPSCCPIAIFNRIGNSSQLELRSITSSRSFRRHHKTRSSRSPRSVARCRQPHLGTLSQLRQHGHKSKMASGRRSRERKCIFSLRC